MAEKFADAVLNCDRGVKISGRGAGHFAEIVARARHVDALVAERATASNEQTQASARCTSRSHRWTP
jgi:methyl-accepting chemotaxis protein